MPLFLIKPSKNVPDHQFSRTRNITIRPQCLAVTKDLVVAALLSQIVFWYLPSKKTGKTKLRVYKAGNYWIAKTREQWIKDTGLTLKQYRRAILVLRQRGIIEVQQKLFAGSAITHIRLIPSVSVLFGKYGPTPVSPLGLPAWALKDRPIQRVPTEITTDDLVPAPETTMKAEEILKQGTGLKKSEKSSLSAFWLSRMSLLYGGYQKSLTMKEIGQLKDLQKYLGEQTRPVIDYILNGWMKFAAVAAAEAGCKAPLQPNIGFILKYHATAVNLMQSIAPMPVEKEMPEPVLQEAETEEPHKLTQEELAEMLAGLKQV